MAKQFSDNSINRIAKSVRKSESIGDVPNSNNQIPLSNGITSFLVKITSVAGYGKYNGKFIKPPKSDVDKTLALTADDFGDAADTENCVVENTGEADTATNSV